MLRMKLYWISQTDNDDWDTYSGAVVAAPDEETARRIHPNRHPHPEEEPAPAFVLPPDQKEFPETGHYSSSTWARRPDHVLVRKISSVSIYEEPMVVEASFHAG